MYNTDLARTDNWLDREKIMQKRIKEYDDFQYKEVRHLNPFYPYRIFARSRYNGDYLLDHQMDIICRFMQIYIPYEMLSANEVLHRLGVDIVDNSKCLYDVLDKQRIKINDITRDDRKFMSVYCNHDYNFEATKNYYVERFFPKDDIENDVDKLIKEKIIQVIENKLNHALEVFGVAGLVWHEDHDKFVYDNYIRHYENYDRVKQQAAQTLRDDARRTKDYLGKIKRLGDKEYFDNKNRMFKGTSRYEGYEEKYGSDFILENYYDEYKKVAERGYKEMLDSLQRNEEEIVVEDVQWLVDHKWSLDLIQREMGFSSRYALKRYLNKHNINYEACKKKAGRPRGTFKNGSARNQIYEDFTKGLVPDTIYDKYKDKYSKRSIDRIYVEWKEDQKPLFD